MNSKKKYWKELKKSTPKSDTECEYIIEITCRGTYKLTDTEHQFLGDINTIPTSEIVKWRKIPKRELQKKTEVYVKV